MAASSMQIPLVVDDIEVFILSVLQHSSRLHEACHHNRNIHNLKVVPWDKGKVKTRITSPRERARAQKGKNPEIPRDCEQGSESNCFDWIDGRICR